MPRGVVCLLSALRVHGIGTQAPFEVWIATPHHSPTPRLDQPALRVVRMSGAALTEGIEPVEIDGVKVPVFNAAKTVADCFKYRNKIGLDVALEALRDGWSRRKLAWMQSGTTPQWIALPTSCGPIWKASPHEPQPGRVHPRPLKQRADATKQDFNLTLTHYRLERLRRGCACCGGPQAQTRT